MHTYINIIFTLFFLLPGFISLKIRQSTREYKELSTFEFTSISLGFSFLIFVLWIFFNYIVLLLSYDSYSFFTSLKQLLIGHDLSILFTKFFFLFIISYLFAFLTFSLIIYNLHWIGLLNKLLLSMGLTRFSSHLTPWDDFQILSKLDWIFVELKDGRTIVGKFGFGSHLPFDKEIVLKRTNLSPIEIYSEDKRLIEYGSEIELTYINYADIKTIHSVKDKSIEISRQNMKDYLYLFSSLFFAASIFLSFFIVLALKLDGYISYNIAIDIWLFILVLISTLYNLKSLSKFS